MHIYNIGIDIIEQSRIGKLLDKSPGAIERLFTKQEREELDSCKGFRQYRTACGRFFALKEAVIKACGIGWQEGVAWHDVILSNTFFCQRVRLENKLKRIADTHHITTIIASAYAEKHLIIAQAHAFCE